MPAARRVDGGAVAAFGVSDLRQLAILAFLAPFAMFLPERWWWWPGRMLSFVTARPGFGHYAALDDRLPDELVDLSGSSRRAFLLEAETAHFIEYLQVLREWFGGWRPRIELAGGHRVRHALAEGRGAILWVSGFESSDLIAKRAMWQAGFRVVHLSRPTHGFSDTRFGVRCLNPIRKVIEDRYLGGRVLLTPRATIGPLRALERELRSGGIVSITVGELARAPVEVAFLGKRLTVATGPAHLAASTGAVLLPVFTLKSGPGAFRVVIGEPIHVSTGLPRELSFRAAVEAYAVQLGEHVRANPLLWTGWRTGALA